MNINVMHSLIVRKLLMGRYGISNLCIYSGNGCEIVSCEFSIVKYPNIMC